MTKDEALKLALEALCVAVEPKKGKVYAREFEPIDCFAMHEQAITAIKEALAQPERDYERGFVDGMQKQMQSSVDRAVNRMAQQEQKPVQVSPLEFVEMVMKKEHLIGNPIFWAEWPNKEKNT